MISQICLSEQPHMSTRMTVLRKRRAHRVSIAKRPRRLRELICASTLLLSFDSRWSRSFKSTLKITIGLTTIEMPISSFTTCSMITSMYAHSKSDLLYCLFMGMSLNRSREHGSLDTKGELACSMAIREFSTASLYSVRR